MFKIGVSGMISCYIMRENKTLKVKKVRTKADSFKFEHGVYYIQDDKIILYKGLIGWKPILIFKEGYSEALSFDNVIKRPKLKNGKIIEDDTVLIDATSIHNLTSRELLDVLAKTTLTKTELIMLIAIIFNLLVTLGIAGAIMNG